MLRRTVRSGRAFLLAALTALLGAATPAVAVTPALSGTRIVDTRTGRTVASLPSSHRMSAIGAVLVDEVNGATAILDANGRRLWPLEPGARAVDADSQDVVVVDGTAERALQLRAVATGTARWSGDSPYRHVVAAAVDAADVVAVGIRAGATGPAGECFEVAIVDRADATIRWSASLRSDALVAAYAEAAPGEQFPLSAQGICDQGNVEQLILGTRTVTTVGLRGLLTFDRATGRLLYAAAPLLQPAGPASGPLVPVRGSLGSTGDVAVVASASAVRGVDPFTRQTRWSRPIGDVPATVVGSGLVTFRNGAKLVVVNAATGAIRWTRTVRADVGLAPGAVLLSSVRTVSAYDATTGRRRWTTTYPGTSTRVAVVGSTPTTTLISVFQQRVVRD